MSIMQALGLVGLLLIVGGVVSAGLLAKSIDEDAQRRHGPGQAHH